MENLTNSIPKVATITQCAVMTGLSYSTIRTLVINNQIKYVRVGKKYLVNLDSLAHFLEGEGKEY